MPLFAVRIRFYTDCVHIPKISASIFKKGNECSRYEELSHAGHEKSYVKNIGRQHGGIEPCLTLSSSEPRRQEHQACTTI